MTTHQERIQLFCAWTSSHDPNALLVLADALEEADLPLTADYCRGPWCTSCMKKVDKGRGGVHSPCAKMMGSYGMVSMTPNREALEDAINDWLRYGEAYHGRFERDPV